MTNKDFGLIVVFTLPNGAGASREAMHQAWWLGSTK